MTGGSTAVDHPDTVLVKLRDAVASHTLVRIRRDLPGTETLHGFVLAATEDRVLLARYPEDELAGYALLRTRDVVRVKRLADADSPRVEALRVAGPWPPPAPDVPVPLDADPAELLAALAAGYGRIAVYQEEDDPDRVVVGWPEHFRRRSFEMRAATPGREHSRHRYGDVTRIDFGWPEESPRP
ncbi:hypothetical protein [Allostreptomyces psammosilenae]|uniref:Uncharacterized protein n=1 Tax=Allostreptomyces psammosilenae TaxID=1892865 RepID=A0A852ZQ09_9ACTN|nr:hypothetical protein [Allostreptomyces psammosilenae]NYI04459.1 hypothetical protein [Allostreptomyces psammosilenae]